MVTLTWPRKKRSEMTVLRQSLHDIAFTCRRRHYATVLPPGDARPLLVPMDQLFATLAELVRMCLTAGPHRLIDFHPNKVFRTRSNLWPTSADELLPLGPEQTVQMLVSWIALQKQVDTGALTLLSCILTICRRLVFPFILLEPSHTILSRELVRRLRPAGPVSGTSDQDNAYHSILEADRMLIALLEDNDDMVFSEPCLRELLDALTYAIGLIHCDAVSPDLLVPASSAKGALPKLKGNLSQLLVMVWNRLPIPRPPLHPNGTDVTTYRYLTTSAYGTAWTLQHGLQQRLRRRECFAPSCRKPIHALPPGRQFQKCSRCGFAAYCDRECQRADWTGKGGAQFAHKVICPALCLLLEAVDRNLNMAPEPFVIAWMYTAWLPNEDMEMVRDWALEDPEMVRRAERRSEEYRMLCDGKRLDALRYISPNTTHSVSCP